jgi:Zn-dependent protease with chaperone function
LDVPRLLVLDLPTVNSITLRWEGKPAVAVTSEALGAGLPGRCAEAVMAHEVAHILMGDVFVGSTKAKWRLVGVGLTAVLLAPFVLLALSFGSSPWLYVGLAAWTILLVFLINFFGPRVFRQNDLLADSVAASITGDPEALKDALVRLDKLFTRSDEPFPAGARYPELLFVYEVRPEVLLREIEESGDEPGDKASTGTARQDLLLRLGRRGAYPRFTIAQRVENLEAIERGHWLAFEA